jgi:PHP family Zn ribbon phosphoesterase
MYNNELESHIKEYEKEYRWLAKYWKNIWNDFLQELETGSFFYVETAKMLRQYANDIMQKDLINTIVKGVEEKTGEKVVSVSGHKLTQPEYHLNCDYCGRLFWSKEAFPVRKMCTACYNNIVND